MPVFIYGGAQGVCIGYQQHLCVFDGIPGGVSHMAVHAVVVLCVSVQAAQK